jgi:hypothetical protein
MADRLVGEREERLREENERLRAALVESHGSYESLRSMVRPLDPALAESAKNWDGPICARAALASSPSPPDREQAVRKIEGMLRRSFMVRIAPVDARPQAEAIVAALFGRGDES